MDKNIDTYTVKLGKNGRFDIPNNIKISFKELFRGHEEGVVIKSSMGFVPSLCVYPQRHLEEKIGEIVALSPSPIMKLRGGRIDLMEHIYERYIYNVISCVGNIKRSKEGDFNIHVPPECLEYALLSAGDDVVVFLRKKHLEIWREDVYQAYEEQILRGTTVLPVPLRQV